MTDFIGFYFSNRVKLHEKDGPGYFPVFGSCKDSGAFEGSAASIFARPNGSAASIYRMADLTSFHPTYAIRVFRSHPLDVAQFANPRRKECPVYSSAKGTAAALKTDRSSGIRLSMCKPDKTLEELIERTARESAEMVWPSHLIRFANGFEGEAGCRVHVNIEPAIPIILQTGGGELIPKLEFDIGVKSLQSCLRIDRSENYLFAVAIEDCVRKTVKGASRKHDDRFTNVNSLESRDPDADALQNGPLLKIWTKGFQSFDDFTSIEKGHIVIFKEGP